MMAKKLKNKTKNGDKNNTPYTENIYASNKDIYNKAKEEKFIDEDDPGNDNIAMDEGSLAQDLDIPGTELDNEMENIGEEDEENNYYSLGGDNHENLEEDQA
ncbi:hypothetical protein QWZ08_10825 [Ferruginibacter paludis]|uniref:hypothetical protein n=1 Tax=Ferruginibacter paludis TaxID=1310417 RepID=UPI0025B4C4AC|nr:hypothetical protein [Ferruginibacter paludis]MDN3656122.1 hypothetical protein [Ferruginibacter paludis]